MYTGSHIVERFERTQRKDPVMAERKSDRSRTSHDIEQASQQPVELELGLAVGDTGCCVASASVSGCVSCLCLRF